MSRNVCVHAFIGKLRDGTIATYQTLPWDHRGWHCGDDGNNTHISFEICEDGLNNKSYFEKVYQEAIELCVYLCKMCGWDETAILDHSEGAKRGIASNHGDVMHWLPRHGKTMDTFRADVREALGFEDKIPVSVSGVPSTGSVADEKKLWNFLMEKIGNEYGVAGLIGNLYAESGLKSDNLQNNYEKKLSHTDATYTASVDNGSYKNFVRDSAGYGLAQWTYWSRKEALLNFAQEQKKSVGDYEMQMEFLWKELCADFKSVVTGLKNAESVLDASNVVLTKFERPADQGKSVQAKRAEFGQKYYDKYAEKRIEAVPDEPVVTLKYKTNDILEFKGGKHYANANASSGSAVKACRVKVTSVYKTGKHPYHCRSVNAAGQYINGVYGWVDEEYLAVIKESGSCVFKEGDIVSIARNATYYNGGAVPGWVTDKNWVIAQDADGDRVVVNKSADGKDHINSPIHAKFLTIIKDDSEWIPEVGDLVVYRGNRHYVNANASSGPVCSGGLAKITDIYMIGKSKHPYHLVYVPRKGATVNGWVDEGSFVKA